MATETVQNLGGVRRWPALGDARRRRDPVHLDGTIDTGQLHRDPSSRPRFAGMERSRTAPRF